MTKQHDLVLYFSASLCCTFTHPNHSTIRVPRQTYPFSAHSRINLVMLDPIYLTVPFIS